MNKVYVVSIDYGYNGGAIIDSAFSEEREAQKYCEENTPDTDGFPFTGVIYYYDEIKIDERLLDESIT